MHAQSLILRVLSLSLFSFLLFFFLMIRRPPRSTPFPTRRSSDLRAAARSRIVARETAPDGVPPASTTARSEEHTSELQSRADLVCRLLLEKKNSRHAGAALRALVGPLWLPPASGRA